MSLVTLTLHTETIRDGSGSKTPIGAEPSIDATLTAGEAATHTTPLNLGYFARVNTVGAIHLKVGVDAVATTAHRRFPPNHTEFIAVPPGARVSVIAAAE